MYYHATQPIPSCLEKLTYKEKGFTITLLKSLLQLAQDILELILNHFLDVGCNLLDLILAGVDSISTLIDNRAVVAYNTCQRVKITCMVKIPDLFLLRSMQGGLWYH
jgi:hypothetical protein